MNVYITLCLHYTQEHYYDPESGSGYIAWRLKTIQRKAAEERGPAVSTSPKGNIYHEVELSTCEMCLKEDMKLCSY